MSGEDNMYVGATISVKKNIMGEYENIYQIVDEFKREYNLYATKLQIENNKIIYSFRDPYVKEDEVFYDMGNIMILIYEAFDDRVFELKILSEEIDEYVAMHRKFKKIIKSHYKPYVEEF